MEQGQSADAAVDRLIEAIVKKLQAHKPTLMKALKHGRVTWRKQGNGEFEIELDLKL